MSAPKRTEPSIPVTDERFQYTPSANTDIRTLFNRIRAQQQKPVKLKRKDTA